MEYVGRAVKKEFQGRGTCLGSVQAYEPTTGLFKIVFEDGGSEDLELSGVSALLVSTEPPPPQLSEVAGSELGGQPKKRRRIVDIGKNDDNSVIGSVSCDNLVGRGGMLGNLT
ncbi:UNVERIFIED_CONTAM: hypothetical protein Sradi_1366100 [Sesamum radiatum]|uniref:PTM/DIR17-like Tudor domain-containing protein n=1 Tax=Sesamum radiatum TaxID=300843 RepID=A0AAW2UQL1_SESRA